MNPPVPSPPSVLAALFPEAAFAAPVGSGAYGSVWLAVFPGGVRRAIKCVIADPSRPDAAARELRAVRLFRSLADPAAPAGTPLHPALLPVLDLREAPDGSAFAYAMPLADSQRPNWESDPAQYRPRTLAGDLVARRALPLPECLDLAAALAAALDCLQRHCLVHRDIKPSNVLYLGGRPVLADFGLLADTREAASVVGTPGYVPTEQHGRFSADLYSLGILLAEAATGRPAAETGLAPVEEADVRHPLYPHFLALLRRTTDPNPARRPQTAAAFLAALRDLREAPRRRRRPPAWVAVLAVLAVLVLAVVQARRRGDSAPPPAPPPVPEAATTTPEPAGRPETSAPPEPPAIPEPATPEPEPAAAEAPEAPRPDVSPVPAPEPPPAPTPAPPPAPEPPASLPATNRPLLYVSRDFADAGAFLQLYTDRIRVGLPLRGYDPEDASLLLVLPPADPEGDPDWTGPAPWRLVPLEDAVPANTPPTAAQDPVFPSDAPYPGRNTRAGMVLLPAGDPYPEAVFLLPDPPYVWEPRLAGLPGATFDDLEHLWWKNCEMPRIDRESEEILREIESDPILSGDFL